MLDRIIQGARQKRNLVITGGAGVGKSYTTNEIIKDFIDRKVNFAATAMTGLASQHLDLGETIQSFTGAGVDTHERWASASVSRLSPGAYERLRAVEAVFNDENSMMRPDFIGLYNKILQIVKKNDRPFGGVQQIFIGDYFQIPPVITKTEALDHRWVFQTPHWKAANFAIVNLTEVKRQNDEAFIRVLNKTRLGIVDREVMDFYQSCKADFSERPVYLFSKVSMVEKMNQKCLSELEGTLYPVEAVIKLDEQVKELAQESEIRALYVKVMAESGLPKTINMKIGCRLMLLANNKVMNTSNGTTGTLVDFVTIDSGNLHWKSPEGLDYDLTWDYAPECLLVKLDEGRHVLVPRKRSSYCSYKYFHPRTHNEVQDITYAQYPVTLGYALTIHKSQGMTIKNVYLDPDGIFGYHMFYVGASRAVSKQGLFVKGFRREFVRTDPQVMIFYQNLLRQGGVK